MSTSAPFVILCLLSLFALTVFEYRPTCLCKIVGVYQIAVHNRIAGEDQKVTVTTLYTETLSEKSSLSCRRPGVSDDESSLVSDDESSRHSDISLSDEAKAASQPLQSPSSIAATLLDGDSPEFTLGRSMPLSCLRRILSFCQLST